MKNTVFFVRLAAGFGLGFILATLSGCDARVGNQRAQLLSQKLFATADEDPDSCENHPTGEGCQRSPGGDGSGGGGEGSGPPAPGTGIDTENYCSDRGTERAKTSVKLASGFVVKVMESYSVYENGRRVQKFREVYSTDSSEASKRKVRQDLINFKKITFPLEHAALVNGKRYRITVCDPSVNAMCGESRITILGSVSSFPRYYDMFAEAGRLTPVSSLPMAILYDENGDPIPGTEGQGEGGAGAGDPEDPEFHQDKCDEEVSPLMLDLDSNGVRLSAPLDGVRFDMNGDGKKDAISWPNSSEDAFLVYDKNHNGQIEDIQELFGDNTRGPDGKKAANGFEALKKYDLNSDGVIDSKDSVFASLQVWKDRGVRSVVEKGELISLQEAGIQSIDLAYIAMDERDVYHNRTKQRSVVASQNGKLYMIFDIWFRTI